MEKWIDVERPGYSGKRREARHQQWDSEYGQGNWRTAWKVGETSVDLIGACALYEDGYFNFLENHPLTLKRLIREASNVYDDAESNIDSGFDYTKQETGRTHLQDIAIRRVLIRRGLWFQGSEPIQIRDRLGIHPLSVILSPGQVPIHMPDLIETPELSGWWKKGSIESFYQSNKFLQIKSSNELLW